MPEWTLVQLTITHVVTNLGCRRTENRAPPEPRQEAREQQQQAAAGDLTQIQEIQAKLASAREGIAALVQRREQAKAQVAAAQQELTALAKRLGDQSI